MNTTLYRSLVLLASMFALTSSFSLSTYNSSPRTSTTEKEEASWTLEIADSKTTEYTVKKGQGVKKKEKKTSEFYEKVRNYPSIKNFINKKLEDKVESTFVLRRAKWNGHFIVGIINEKCELYLFKGNDSFQKLISSVKKPYILEKTDNRFLVKNGVEETNEGNLKLRFNGVSGNIIGLLIKGSKYGDIISSCVECQVYSNNNNPHILFWIVVILLIATFLAALYAIYKY